MLARPRLRTAVPIDSTTRSGCCKLNKMYCLLKGSEDTVHVRTQSGPK
jgi:hypothetical protein